MQNVQVARACNERKDVSIKFQLIVEGILPVNILLNENVILPDLFYKYRNISMRRFLWTSVYVQRYKISQNTLKLSGTVTIRICVCFFDLLMFSTVRDTDLSYFNYKDSNRLESRSGQTCDGPNFGFSLSA